MIIYIFTNRKISPIVRSLAIGCVIFLWSCDGSVPGSLQTTGVDRDTSSFIDTAKIYQELGFLGDIKQEHWKELVLAVQENIAYSRKEVGNLAFSLYQPEDGKLQPIWFERYRDIATHNAHMKQDYFRNAIQFIGRSLEGKARSIYLRELREIPAMRPILSERPADTRHVVVLFDVKPEKRKAFIDMMTDVAKSSRQATGNLEFNIYRYQESANKFMLLEGWRTIADHEAQIKQPHIKKLGMTIKGFFVTDPMNTRWLVNDISQ